MNKQDALSALNRMDKMSEVSGSMMLPGDITERRFCARDLSYGDGYHSFFCNKFKNNINNNNKYYESYDNINNNWNYVAIIYILIIIIIIYLVN